MGQPHNSTIRQKILSLIMMLIAHATVLPQPPLFHRQLLAAEEAPTSDATPTDPLALLGFSVTTKAAPGYVDDKACAEMYRAAAVVQASGATNAVERLQKLLAPDRPMEVVRLLILAERQLTTRRFADAKHTLTRILDAQPATLTPAHYAVASGIFNVKLATATRQWHAYMIDTIDQLATQSTGCITVSW